MNYNYLEAIIKDVTEWLEHNHFDISEYADLEEAQEYLYDALQAEDAVTGNGKMGYATRVDYENFLCHNWDLLLAAIKDFYVDMNDIIELLETQDITAILKYCDSLIRCNLLSEAIAIALDKINNTKEI